MVNGIYVAPISTSVILVIGNGFDLSCGLKTKYSDFFNDYVILNVLQNPEAGVNLYDSRREALNKEPDSAKYVLADNADISLWEYYLADKLPTKNQYSTKSWFDIEDLIADSFRSGGCWNFLKSHMYKNHNWQPKEHGKDTSLLEILGYALNERYKNELYDNEDNLIDSEYYNALLTELNILEKHLGEYIKGIVENNNEYMNVKQKKIDELKEQIKNVLQAKYERPIKLTLKIASFNYTKTPNDNIYYVHGTYSNPIIGIENLEDVDQKLVIFSKVKRCADEANSSYSRIGKDAKYDIAFYGTSFGKSDYRDYRLLQEGYLTDDGSLIIFYTNYDDQDRLGAVNSAVANLVKDIFKLNYLEDAYDLILKDDVVKIREIQ